MTPSYTFSAAAPAIVPFQWTTFFVVNQSEGEHAIQQRFIVSVLQVFVTLSPLYAGTINLLPDCIFKFEWQKT